MTADELAAIVDGIAPVIRDYVTRVHGELVQRVTIAETHLAAVHMLCRAVEAALPATTEADGEDTPLAAS